MANDEHVALLKLEGWNAWRDKNPDIRRLKFPSWTC